MKKTIYTITLSILGLLFFLGLRFLLYNFHHTSETLLDGIWQISNGTHTIESELPYYAAQAEEGVYTYSTEFELVNADTLIIPSFSAYGYEVFLNELRVAKLNNPETKTSNIWNQIQMITFDPRILKQENTLEIKLYGLFDHGINATPYLTDQKKVLPMLAIADFFKNNLYYIASGVSISFGLLFLLIGFNIPENKELNFSFGLTMFFAGLYLLDYPFRLYSGSLPVFLFQRKVLFISMYLASLFLLMGIEHFIFNKKIISKYMVFIILPLSVIMLFMPDFTALRAVNQIAMFFMLFMIVSACLYILIKREIVFVFSSTVLLLCALNDAYNMLTNYHTIFMISYGVITIAVSIGIIIIRYFKNTYGNMLFANKKALFDPLTGAYNRNIIENLVLNPEDVIIMVDIDKFKEINDKYGHDEGDEVLKQLTQETMQHLRTDDKFIRMGGDEFLIYIKNCSTAIAEERIREIQQALSKKAEKYTFSFSYGLSPVRHTLNATMKEADIQLYHMKKKSKGAV